MQRLGAVRMLIICGTFVDPQRFHVLPSARRESEGLLSSDNTHVKKIEDLFIRKRKLYTGCREKLSVELVVNNSSSREFRTLYTMNGCDLHQRSPAYVILAEGHTVVRAFSP